MRRVPVDADGIARVAARQIYILPTGTGFLYGAVCLVMLLGSLNYQNNLALLFTFLMASIGLVAMHHCWFNLLGVEVQARAGSEVFAGAPAGFEVFLRNGRGEARFDLRVFGGLEPVRAEYVDAKDQTALDVRLTSERRGLLPLREVMIETRHPMQLFRAWSYASCAVSVLVYPRPAERAPPPPAADGDGRQAGANGGEGAEDFLGQREYRRGDSLRRLDWKAAARERGLVVKQFVGDRGQEVWLDWTSVPAEDPERRIALLARQVLDMAAAGVRFGMRLPGVQIPPERGDTQVRRCLSQLSLLDHG